MIIEVTDKKLLNVFIRFPEKLYFEDNSYAYPIYFALKRELKREVLLTRRYTALLCERNGKIVGRLLFTVSASKQKGKDVGYFSFFDCIDDDIAAKELFSYMEKSLKGKVDYVEGTFTPYDPDTRRGILVKGFDLPHTVFTSKNFPYYGGLVEKQGYTKAYDTYTVTLPLEGKSAEIVEAIGERLNKNSTVKVDSLNLKNVERDLNDVCEILKEATCDLNYQEAPSIDMIRSFFKSARLFINPSLIKIARTADTGKPVGFCVVLLDINEILIKTKGRLRPLAFILGKRKITGARGMLQYVVPEYQRSGTLALLFKEEYAVMKRLGVTYFEGGTIMEENKSSWKPLVKLGGNIGKIYRIYGKEI